MGGSDVVLVPTKNTRKKLRVILGLCCVALTASLRGPWLTQASLLALSLCHQHVTFGVNDDLWGPDKVQRSLLLPSGGYIPHSLT